MVHPDTTKYQHVLTATAEGRCAASRSLANGLQGKKVPVTPSCKAGLTKCYNPMTQVYLLWIYYLLEIAQKVVNGDPSIGSFFLTRDDSGTLEVEGS